MKPSFCEYCINQKLLDRLSMSGRGQRITTTFLGCNEDSSISEAAANLVESSAMARRDPLVSERLRSHDQCHWLQLLLKLVQDIFYAVDEVPLADLVLHLPGVNCPISKGVILQ